METAMAMAIVLQYGFVEFTNMEEDHDECV